MGEIIARSTEMSKNSTQFKTRDYEFKIQRYFANWLSK